MPSISGVTKQRVRDRVVGGELLLRQAAVEVVHRNVTARLGELAVDPPDVLLHVAAQLAVLPHVVPAWHGHLQEHQLGAELGAPLKQLLHRQQALHDSLGVVEAVDAEQHGPADELLVQGLGSPCAGVQLGGGSLAYSAASMEMGDVEAVTTRPSGMTTDAPRTSIPVPASSRAQERRKLPRYSSVWKETTSAPSRPVSTCSRHGSRAKMLGDGQGTCRKKPIG